MLVAPLLVAIIALHTVEYNSEKVPLSKSPNSLSLFIVRILS
jgi:hypothetical protein